MWLCSRLRTEKEHTCLCVTRQSLLWHLLIGFFLLVSVCMIIVSAEETWTYTLACMRHCAICPNLHVFVHLHVFVQRSGAQEHKTHTYKQKFHIQRSCRPDDPQHMQVTLMWSTSVNMISATQHRTATRIKKMATTILKGFLLFAVSSESSSWGPNPLFFPLIRPFRLSCPASSSAVVLACMSVSSSSRRGSWASDTTLSPFLDAGGILMLTQGTVKYSDLASKDCTPEYISSPLSLWKFRLKSDQWPLQSTWTITLKTIKRNAPPATKHMQSRAAWARKYATATAESGYISVVRESKSSMKRWVWRLRVHETGRYYGITPQLPSERTCKLVPFWTENRPEVYPNVCDHYKSPGRLFSCRDATTSLDSLEPGLNLQTTRRIPCEKQTIELQLRVWDRPLCKIRRRGYLAGAVDQAPPNDSGLHEQRSVQAADDTDALESVFKLLCWHVPSRVESLQRTEIRGLLLRAQDREPHQEFILCAQELLFWKALSADAATEGSSSGQEPGHTQMISQVHEFR